MTTIKCNECKCLIEKKDAQEVLVRDLSPNIDRKDYYCNKCKKPYDKACYGFVNIYYKKGQIEVDKEGNNLEVKRLQEELKGLEDELKACRKGNDEMYKYNIFYLISISILIATIIYILSN